MRDNWKVFQALVILIDKYLPILTLIVSAVFVFIKLASDPFFAYGEEIGAYILPIFTAAFMKVITKILKTAVLSVD